jgi:phage-related protein (TIGR01555 family)
MFGFLTSFLPACWKNLFPNFWMEVEAIANLTAQFGWNWRTFDTMYRSSWVAERVVNCVADDITSKWRTFTHPDPNVVRIRTKFEKDRRIDQLINEAVRVARKYGGGCIQPMLKGQVNEESLALPFDIDSVKKGDLLDFQVLNRFDYAPLGGYSRDINVYNKDVEQSQMLFGDYEWYTLIRIQNVADVLTEKGISSNLSMLPNIHRSWMIKFFGTKADYYPKLFLQGWSDSVLVPLIGKIAAVEQGFYSMFLYLDAFNIDVFKIPNLVEQIKVGPDALIQKMMKFNESMRATKIRFFDSSDTMERNQMGSLAATVPVFQQLLQYIVGATGVPITKILGSSVGGWSTGDNELTQYYDRIESLQSDLSEQLSVIDGIIERHLFGRQMDIEYTFPSKREVPESERIENQRKKAEMYTMYIQNRVMTPKIVAENIKEEFTGITSEYISGLEDEFLDYEQGMSDIPDDEEEDKEPKDEKEKDNG